MRIWLSLRPARTSIIGCERGDLLSGNRSGRMLYARARAALPRPPGERPGRGGARAGDLRYGRHSRCCRSPSRSRAAVRRAEAVRSPQSAVRRRGRAEVSRRAGRRRRPPRAVRRARAACSSRPAIGSQRPRVRAIVARAGDRTGSSPGLRAMVCAMVLCRLAGASPGSASSTSGGPVVAIRLFAGDSQQAGARPTGFEPVTFGFVA